MTSKTDPEFWRLYHELPDEIKAAARRAFAKFEADSNHPSLNFKPLGGDQDFYSVRVTLKYRAVAQRRGDVWAWFWIGSHADFDRTF